MTPLAILFVDDDAQLLGGLSRAYRKRTDEWAMTFAVGGPAALRELDARRFDVIVSDMRMPEIDGVRVLARARERDPASIRLLLSGLIEPTGATRPVVSSHQLFMKPYDARQLGAIVERACAVRMRFAEPAVVALSDRLQDAAPVSVAVQELVAALGGMPLTNRLEDLVGSEPAIATRVVNLARCLHDSATSLATACRVLGPQTIAALAIAAHAFGAFGATTADHDRALARALAMQDAALSTDAAVAFAAGLLHDVGALVVRSLDVPGYLGPVCGAYVLACWSLPVAVLEAAFGDPVAARAAAG